LAWLSLNIGSLLKKEGMVLMFAVVISISALTQAGVGIVQFSKQGSVGLSRFGEPVLISSQGSSSTVRAEGGRFLRAYGTFPHPNVLAGFLAIGLGALGYLYVSCEEKIKEKFGKEWAKRRWKREDILKAGKIYFFSKYFFYRMLIAGAFFVTTFGLAVTFSRSGWIAGLVVVSLLAFLTMVRSFGAGLRLAVLVIACSVCTYLILSPIILPRADISKNEPAVQDRLVYARIGFEIARDNPMGVGVGNQVLYGVSDARYKDHDLRYVWQWEPVHNLYLLIADEIGWIGVLSFISFILVLAFRLLRNRSREAVLAIALLAGILTAGLFDHYLWTLQPGRLMLWVVVGLALSQVASNTRGQDS
jgi:O-antigen ligase